MREVATSIKSLERRVFILSRHVADEANARLLKTYVHLFDALFAIPFFSVHGQS